MRWGSRWSRRIANYAKLRTEEMEQLLGYAREHLEVVDGAIIIDDKHMSHEHLDLHAVAFQWRKANRSKISTMRRDLAKRTGGHGDGLEGAVQLASDGHIDLIPFALRSIIYASAFPHPTVFYPAIRNYAASTVLTNDFESFRHAYHYLTRRLDRQTSRGDIFWPFKEARQHMIDVVSNKVPQEYMKEYIF